LLETMRKQMGGPLSTFRCRSIRGSCALLDRSAQKCARAPPRRATQRPNLSLPHPRQLQCSPQGPSEPTG
jgi:hypothetical protein